MYKCPHAKVMIFIEMQKEYAGYCYGTAGQLFMNIHNAAI